MAMDSLCRPASTELLANFQHLGEISDDNSSVSPDGKVENRVKQIDEEEMLQNSMPEDDPNENISINKEELAAGHRWGPRHKGAIELASLYTTGN